ncbi:MAG: molybdate ABC transporter substrate-binding protein [bacterium]|nr:molybdate ABC transporter substrate-binding protein [bacterium]
MSQRPAVAALVVLFFAFGSAAAEETSLQVSAASSMADVLRAIFAEFEIARPGARIELNIGTSDELLRQARRGRPIDLYVSASPLDLDRLNSAGMLSEGRRQTLASNSLVVIMPPTGTRPRILQDLIRPEYDVIAIGEPRTVPVGRYAAEALESLRLFESLRTRLVYGESTQRVIDFVARGDVGAGLVFKSDAVAAAERVVIVFDIPAEAHRAILYEVALFESSQNVELADQLLLFLRSSAAREQFDRAGFLPPP